MNNISDDSDVIFLDIDGTIVEHNYNPSVNPERYLNTTIGYLMSNLDKAVVITTSRPLGYTIKIKKFLQANKVNVIAVLANLPTGKRILINDHCAGEEQKAIAINCLRDVGIE